MKSIKLLFGYILSFVIGYLFLHNIAQIFLFLLIILNNKYSQTDISNVGILLLILYLAGGLLGLRSFRKKDEYFRAWKPSKSKLLTNLIVAIVYSTSIYFLIGTLDSRLFFISLLTTFIIAYPFSALLTYLYKERRKIKNKTKWILILITINPVFTVFLNSLNVLILPR